VNNNVRDYGLFSSVAGATDEKFVRRVPLCTKPPSHWKSTSRSPVPPSLYICEICPSFLRINKRVRVFRTAFAGETIIFSIHSRGGNPPLFLGGAAFLSLSCACSSFLVFLVPLVVYPSLLLQRETSIFAPCISCCWWERNPSRPARPQKTRSVFLKFLISHL